MPSQIITATPTIVASLTASTDYAFQNKSPHVIHIEVAGAAPTTPAGAFSFNPYEFGTMRKEGTDEVYVWADSVRVGAGNLVYDELA